MGRYNCSGRIKSRQFIKLFAYLQLLERTARRKPQSVYNDDILKKLKGDQQTGA